MAFQCHARAQGPSASHRGRASTLLPQLAKVRTPQRVLEVGHTLRSTAEVSRPGYQGHAALPGSPRPLLVLSFLNSWKNFTPFYVLSTSLK